MRRPRTIRPGPAHATSPRDCNFTSRGRLLARLGIPALLILAGLAAYFCFPSLRLPADANRLQSLPGLRAVDAHRYDQEWFDAARAGRIDILGALYDAHYPLDAKT